MQHERQYVRVLPLSINLVIGIAEQTCEVLYLQAGHTSIYSIKSQGRQVYY